jgi:hypothetical protein
MTKETLELQGANLKRKHVVENHLIAKETLDLQGANLKKKT